MTVITQTPNLVASTRLDAYHKQLFDVMNGASQKSGGLGSRLDYMQYGALPSGSVTQMHPVAYSTTPVLGTAVYVHAAITLGAAAADVTTAITNPDVPRVLSVKGNAGGITGNVVITGTDFAGNAITDTIALSAASEVSGIYAFATVTNIHVPVKTNGSGDTVSVGVQNKIGYQVAIPNASLAFANSFNGAIDAGSITAAATVKGSFYAPAGTLDGAKILIMYFYA